MDGGRGEPAGRRAVVGRRSGWDGCARLGKIVGAGGGRELAEASVRWPSTVW